MNSRTLFDKATKVWWGVGPTKLPNLDSKSSVGSAVLSALAKYPDKIGQVRL